MRSSRLSRVMQRAGRWLPLLVMLLLVLLAPAHLPAAEYAVFKTGFRLEIERHEQSGAVTRLFLAGGGVVEVRAGDIRRFEADERVPGVASPAAAGPGEPGDGDLRQLVRSAGEAHGLDPDLIESVIHVESAGNPRAVSPKGASGLMQLMPETARAAARPRRVRSRAKCGGRHALPAPVTRPVQPRPGPGPGRLQCRTGKGGSL